MALQAKALVRITGILIFLCLSAVNVAMAQEGEGDSGSTELNINDGLVEINKAGDYIITGNSQVTNHTITVELPKTNDVANITIKGVKIKTGMDICPFNIKQGVVHLTLEDDDNELQAGDFCAALQVSWYSELVITEKSTGKLTARGGGSGAGIGGWSTYPVGSITIAGGTVVATGGQTGAGIGGGLGSRSCSIFIKGGKVTTTGNIGDDEYGNYATGEISGGTIVCKSFTSDLTITGGSVHTQDNSVDNDGKGMAVVKGLPKETEVTSITIDEGKYGSTDVFTDKDGLLYLYIPQNTAVPVSLTIDNQEYTIYVTLADIITIKSEESYDENIHKDKNIRIASNVTFTINTPNASVIDLTIEPGGTLLTKQPLDVKGTFVVQRNLANKWTTFCSPVPLTLFNGKWATSDDDTDCLYLKSGYTPTTNPEWKWQESIEANTPYLLAADKENTSATFTAQNVTLPGAQKIEIPNPSDFDNNLLFQANPSLTTQKLEKKIYVLDVYEGEQAFILKDSHTLQPFEAFFVASPAVMASLKSINLFGSSNGQPTSIAKVKDQKNSNFKAYSNGRGTLTFENQGEPAAVIVANALGKGLFVYSNFTGCKQLYGLSAGVYFVRSNKEVKTVIVD